MLEQLKLLKDYTIWEPELWDIFILYTIFHVMGTQLNQIPAWSESILVRTKIWEFPRVSTSLHMSSEFCLDETEGSEKILYILVAWLFLWYLQRGSSFTLLNAEAICVKWCDARDMDPVVREWPLLSDRWGVSYSSTRLLSTWALHKSMTTRYCNLRPSFHFSAPHITNYHIT